VIITIRASFGKGYFEKHVGPESGDQFPVNPEHPKDVGGNFNSVSMKATVMNIIHNSTSAWNSLHFNVTFFGFGHHQVLRKLFDFQFVGI